MSAWTELDRPGALEHSRGPEQRLLAQLVQDGFPVAPGILLGPSFLERDPAGALVWGGLQQAILGDLAMRVASWPGRRCRLLCSTGDEQVVAVDGLRAGLSELVAGAAEAPTVLVQPAPPGSARLESGGLESIQHLGTAEQRSLDRTLAALEQRLAAPVAIRWSLPEEGERERGLWLLSVRRLTAAGAHRSAEGGALLASLDSALLAALDPEQRLLLATPLAARGARLRAGLRALSEGASTGVTLLLSALLPGWVRRRFQAGLRRLESELRARPEATGVRALVRGLAPGWGALLQRWGLAALAAGAEPRYEALQQALRDRVERRALGEGERLMMIGRLDRAEQVLWLTLDELERAAADPGFDLRARVRAAVAEAATR